MALGTSTHSDGWGLTQGAGRVGVGRARAPVTLSLRWRGDGTGGQEATATSQELPWGTGSYPSAQLQWRHGLRGRYASPDVGVRPSPPGSFLQGQASPGPPPCGARLLPSSQFPGLEGGCVVGCGSEPGPSGTPCPTGVAARSLPPRPHPRPGRAAGGHGGCPGVPLRLGDGVLPHHTLQTPRQVGRLGAGLPCPLTCTDPLGAGRQGPAGPRTLTLPCPSPSYWPVLDTALRVAAFSRGVHVRLLVSCWLNTDPRMFPFLRSLQALSNPAANVSLDVVRMHPWAGPGSGLSAPNTSSLFPQESLHRARGEPLQHPLQQGQPQQVHGNREGGLHR